MTRINLLPWRETHRREKNNEFFVVLGLCMAVAAGVGFAGFKYVQDKVTFQDRRNARLDREIALLQEELREIKALERTKNDLLERMEIIQKLQGERPQIVHAFQEAALNVPDGVYLTDMKQVAGNRIEIQGRAESNARVSALMRRMDRSEYFSDPRLEIIQANEDESISTFKLSVVQTKPKGDDGEEVPVDGA